MTRAPLSILSLLVLTLAACPDPENPKAPDDEPGPADRGSGDDGGETGPKPKPAT